MLLADRVEGAIDAALQDSEERLGRLDAGGVFVAVILVV
jgi:hypothetical protein